MKRKKKHQAKSRWPFYLGVGGAVFAGVLALVGGVWGVVKLATGSTPAEPVTAWEKFDTDEQEFGFSYPAGWGIKSYGIHDRREVLVKKASSSITVKENLTGSLIGDIAAATGGAFPENDERLPVAKVHDMRCPTESKTYKEDHAVTVATRLGKARRSTYVDGARRGYRATVLLNQTALDVFCECRDSDWEILRPAFEQFIESIGRGG